MGAMTIVAGVGYYVYEWYQNKYVKNKNKETNYKKHV